MSLFALIAALLLEQLNPIGSRKYLHNWLSGYAHYFQQHFNSGEYGHGRTAWWLAVLPVLVASVLIFRGLQYVHPMLAWLFNVAVLYLCLGFRKYSQCFMDIQLALRSARLDEARTLLSGLLGRATHELNAQEIERVTIETSLVAALHHLFGVVVWFVLFSLSGAGGAAGALLYCLALGLDEHWLGELNAGESGEAKFDGFARKMCFWLEWTSIRLTAVTFAIVGNFEDTVYCWRSQAFSWPDSEMGILLASAAGASGVRLGGVMHRDGDLLDRPELGVGDKGAGDAMHCTIRLVWRSVLFMLVILFMLTLASLLD